MRRKIYFKKWIDPFGTNYGELEFPGYIDKSDEPDDTPYDDGYGEKEDNSSSNFRMLSTPNGILPLVHECYPGKIWNMWVGYTNFDLTPSIVNEICTLPGVELMFPLSRYRFQFGVGLCFKPSEVFHNIQTVICGDIHEEIIQISGMSQLINPEIGEIDRIRLDNEIKQMKAKHWILYIAPNNSVFKYESDTIDEEMSKNINNCYGAQVLVGGIILSSFDKLAPSG